MLKVGALAPPFRAPSTIGREVSLAEHRGRPLIVYFFHKAFTPNCTAELKGFRDNYDDLKRLGWDVIGMSTDQLETQCRFAVRHAVTFPVVADPTGDIAKRYDVMWPLLPFARRVAYALSPNHTILSVFRHDFQVSRHLDDVFHFVQTWKRHRRPGSAFSPWSASSGAPVKDRHEKVGE